MGATIGLVVIDILTLIKNKKEKQQLEVLRDWCAETGLNPTDYIKALKECSKMIKEVNEK